MPITADKQFNMHFSVVCEEFFGKNGAARFTSGGKRFTATKILSAGFLSTRQNVLGDGARLPTLILKPNYGLHAPPPQETSASLHAAERSSAIKSLPIPHCIP